MVVVEIKQDTVLVQLTRLCWGFLKYIDSEDLIEKQTKNRFNAFDNQPASR